jgi:allantoinase
LQFQAASILIEDGIIQDIIKKQKISGAIDFKNQVIMPGAIDAHVHINEPGNTNWEGFETATRAAAKGGITTIVDMPLNSLPVTTTIDAFKEKLAAAEGKLHVNCGFWGGAVDGNTKVVLELIDAGCIGIKVFLSHSGLDEFPKISKHDLNKIMSVLGGKDIPLLAHCEFDTLPAEHQMSSFPRSYTEYLNSRPKSWENEAIKFLVGLCEKYNCKTHIVHLASDESIEFIRVKKEKGLPLTVETCPHYILFHSEMIEDGNTLFKCAPPIRNEGNRTNLKHAIKSKVIDFIASDHSPAPPEIKELESGNFAKAWGGISGLQYLVSASWTAMKGQLSLEEYIPLLTNHPAQFLGLDNQKGCIAPGYSADLCIWNPEQSFVPTTEKTEHRHKISPYIGQTLIGEIQATIVNGQFTFQNGTVSNSKYGRIILGHRNRKIP